MKTIEQILEGVTAGGQWDNCMILPRPSSISTPQALRDAVYAVRAARSFPALIRVLEDLEAEGRPHGNDAGTGEPCGCSACDVWQAAMNVLESAMKD